MRITHTSHALARSSGRQTDDATRVHVRDKSVIAALADGVGSSREGGAAARRAVDMIVDYYLTRPQAWSPRRALAEFVRQINRTFYQESHLRHGQAELLCTLSVVVIEEGHLYGVNVGDSPVYLFRNGKLLTLSEAHSLEGPGLGQGLARAIGMEESTEPYAFELEAADGDLITLCSDGVGNQFDAESLSEALAKRPTARYLVSRSRELIRDRPEHLDDAAAIVLDLQRRDWPHNDKSRSLEIMTDLRPGQWHDEYELVRPLQDGSRVWLAHRNDGQSFVLKFPPIEALDDEMRRDGFLREVWQATRIDSEDFVRAFVPSSNPLRYYVMEYIDTKTLREVLAAGPMHVEDAVGLGNFLLRACQFLLQRDHAHGDIKPDNLLVLRDGAGPKFRMLDFGSSAELFTVTSRAGTPTYMAPERFFGAPLSERTELFAIGVTLYEALTNKYPYGEIERFQTPRFDHQPKSLMAQNPAVAPWLEAVILRAIAADPMQRYQNFSEMAFELNHPERVEPYHRKDAPLLERDPVRFYKLLCFALLISNVYFLVHYVLAR
jgi:serine/threonine protein phosphatase PrpC